MTIANTVKFSVSALAVGILSLKVLMASPAHAQGAPALGLPGPAATAAPLDYREKMRQLVQAISTYGRSLNPKFVVMVDNGLDLISKVDPEDDSQFFPARAYMRTIDAVLQTNLLAAVTPPKTVTPAPRTTAKLPPRQNPRAPLENQPHPKLEIPTQPEDVRIKKEDPVLSERRNRLIANVQMAKLYGIGIFNLEFATKAKKIDALYAQSAARGFVPFVANSPVLGRIPPYPKAAFRANPTSLSTPAQAKNHLYVAQSQGFGSAADYVQAMSTTNNDIVITSVFHGRAPLSKLDVERLKYKNLGARRLVLAEINVASAATYDYFWQPGWGPGSPAYVGAPYRKDPDRYRTLYWDPAWQSVLLGGTASFVYGVFDLGFDGVIIKGTESWRYFESGGEDGS